MEQEIDEERRPSRSRNIIVTIVVIIILILILILFLYMIRSPLFFRSGAYSTSTTAPVTQVVTTPTLSLENSYVFASPLRAKTGGEQIRITVFILNDRGLGMSGKTVSIGGGGQLQVTPIQSVTDSQGRATFDIASQSSPGVYIIQASVDGASLTQKVTVSFD